MADNAATARKLDDLLRQVLEKELIREGTAIVAADAPAWWKARDIVVAARGRLRCGDEEVAVRVGLSGAFPIALPEIAVDDEARLPLPHVEADGKLCYERDANLVDRHDPFAVLEECVERARETLRSVVDGDRAAEYAQEIPAYWSRLAGEQVYALVEPGDEPHATTAILDHGVLVAVADDPTMYGLSLPRRSTEHLTFENAVYVPIDPASTHPAFVPKDLLVVERLREFISVLPGEARARLDAALARCRKRQELVVLGIARPRHGRALVAVRLRGIRGEHPLFRRDAEPLVSAVDVKRRDRTYLMHRGGASATRRSTRVLLVGCGAVGGHVAVALARAGVGELRLVDHDSFTMENAFRHAVGMGFVGVLKVVGLKQYLEASVPFVRVGAYPMKFHSLLEQWPAAVAGHDLIISATGHPTLDLEINSMLWADASHPPAIFTWLEPLGLGGHAVCTRVPAADASIARGCLECLYRRPIVGGGLVNDAAFADPGRHYTRDLLGCGTGFLPFSDLDAGRTAEMTTRVALDVIDGIRTSGALASWKGSDRVFRAGGFNTTPRYDGSSSEEIVEARIFSRDGCPVCEGRP